MSQSFNYRHLFYFWVVAKEGGIARAAERLDMAVQTISAQVRELEQALGVSLLRSEGRNLVLTDAGVAALHEADHIFALGEQLPHRVREVESAEGGRLRRAIGFDYVREAGARAGGGIEEGGVLGFRHLVFFISGLIALRWEQSAFSCRRVKRYSALFCSLELSDVFPSGSSNKRPHATAPSGRAMLIAPTGSNFFGRVRWTRTEQAVQQKHIEKAHGRRGGQPKVDREVRLCLARSTGRGVDRAYR